MAQEFRHSYGCHMVVPAFKVKGSLCSSCESGRGVFTLSRHGRPLEWAIVAQEVWRWPDSQVNADDNVWQACLLSLGLASGEGTLPFINMADLTGLRMQVKLYIATPQQCPLLSMYIQQRLIHI